MALAEPRIGSHGRPVNRGASRGAAVGLPASLLRLHRNGRANLLVTGGSPEQRAWIAQSFHRRSPLSHESFLALDSVRDADRVERLLQSWLLACVDTGGACLRVGALFLDSIGALSRDSQRSLLLLARRLDASREGYGVPPEEGPLRLMAGDRHHLAREPNAGSCSPSLIDHLDKIRVELDVSRTRGAA